VNAVTVAACPRCGRRPQLPPRGALPDPSGREARRGWARLDVAGRLRSGVRTRPALAALLGVVLLGSALAIGTVTLRSLTRRGDGAARAPAPPAPTARERLEEVVLELQGFVARARGLSFEAPVQVRMLEDVPFRSRLQASTGTRVADLGAREATLQALRLLPPGVGLAQLRAQAIDRVVGFYDAETKALYVKGSRTTPRVRAVIVHELTHALQDQQFGLAGVTAGDNDATLAARAVVEGDAERTMRAYVATLPAREQDAVRRETPARGDDIYSQAYHTSVENFPYVVGLAWNDAVRAAGGQAALDEAFRALPQSSAEVIHPERYLARIGPRAPPPPAADGPVVDQGVVGEYQLIYLLARAIDDQDAFEIAQAWGGSRYVTWRARGGWCTRARFTMLSAAADRALAAALGVWAETAGATLEGSGPVTLTACTGAA
jgi:hypothetical protein